jgi:hypothetical protein
VIAMQLAERPQKWLKEWRSPKLKSLLACLDGIARPNVETDVINQHAITLDFAATQLAAGLDRRAHKIGHDKKRGYFATPVRSKGKAREFERLKKAANSRSLRRWLAAWAATSSGTHRLILQHLPENMRPHKGIPATWVAFSAPGFVTNAPRAEDAIAAISEAQRSLDAAPVSERRKRTSDPQMERFLKTARAVFQSLTNRKPTLTWDNYGSRLRKRK